MNYDRVTECIRETVLQCGRKPEEVRWIAVSKGQSLKTLQEAYQKGCREFGENRALEMVVKKPLLPADCHWHFIGHLQKNKASKVLGSALIHSVDSVALAEKLQQQSAREGLITPILLQMNLLQEPTKQGFSLDLAEESRERLFSFSHLRIEGLMTIAPFVIDTRLVRRCFKETADLLKRWQKLPQVPDSFRELSMGMSQDFQIAIEEGATWLRIGSLLFSPRK